MRDSPTLRRYAPCTGSVLVYTGFQTGNAAAKDELFGATTTPFTVYPRLEGNRVSRNTINVWLSKPQPNFFNRHSKSKEEQMLRRSRGLPAIHFFALALFGSMQASSANAGDEDHGSAVGTWILTAELAPGFVETELTAINPGGTLTITGSAFNPHTSQNPFLPPFLVADFSDGYGSLRRQGSSNRFAGTFKRLVFAGARTDSDLYGEFFPGQYVGVATIQFLITLRQGPDGDTMAGPFTFQVRNLRNEVVGTGSGTASFVRLNIEPLTP